MTTYTLVSGPDEGGLATYRRSDGTRTFRARQSWFKDAAGNGLLVPASRVKADRISVKEQNGEEQA